MPKCSMPLRSSKKFCSSCGHRLDLGDLQKAESVPIIKKELKNENPVAVEPKEQANPPESKIDNTEPK